jgi:hypothetical protein
MMPMNIISTQFISFSDIDTGETDLFEDAFSLDTGFADITGLFETIRPPEPDENLIENFIRKIRKSH